MSITLSHVSFGYNNNRLLLSDTSCTFLPGTITAIIGGNGVGKTTLSKLCMGLCRGYTGDIHVFEHDTKHMKRTKLASYVYYCFQNPDKQLFCDTVLEEVSFALKYKNLPMDKVEHILREFDLYDVKDQYPLSLSSGQKQRLAIACGVVLNPPMLFLDEPTSSLDVENASQLANILLRLKKQGTGVVIISHDLDFIDKVADKVYELKGGALYEQNGCSSKTVSS